MVVDLQLKTWQKGEIMRNNTKNAEAFNGAPVKISLSFVLIILGINLLAGVLSLLRLIALPDVVLLAITYLCQLLTLAAQFIAIGGALHCLARGCKKTSFLYLLLAIGGFLFALLIAGVAESFLYLDVLTVLLSQIASSLVNSLLYFLLYGGLLILVWLLIFKRKNNTAPPPFFGSHPITHSSLLISGGLLLAKLAFQIADTVSFIDTYWPSIYTNEIISLVLDYIFLVVSALVGHFVACGAATWLALEDDEEE